MTFAEWLESSPDGDKRRKREILCQMVCNSEFFRGGWHSDPEKAAEILDKFHRTVEDFHDLLRNTFIPRAEEYNWNKSKLRRL